MTLRAETPAAADAAAHLAIVGTRVVPAAAVGVAACMCTDVAVVAADDAERLMIVCMCTDVVVVAAAWNVMMSLNVVCSFCCEYSIFQPDCSVVFGCVHFDVAAVVVVVAGVVVAGEDVAGVAAGD